MFFNMYLKQVALEQQFQFISQFYSRVIAYLLVLLAFYQLQFLFKVRHSIQFLFAQFIYLEPKNANNNQLNSSITKYRENKKKYHKIPLFKQKNIQKEHRIQYSQIQSRKILQSQIKLKIRMNIKYLMQQRWKYSPLYSYFNIIMDQEPREGDNQIVNNAINQQSLRHLLTDILLTNSAYDCMPINSSICTVDKSISLYDAINILISKDIEELLVWDDEQCSEIWMLTLVDAIRFTTHAFKSHLRREKLDFTDFQKQKVEQGMMVSKIHEVNPNEVEVVIARLREKKIQTIIKQITEITKESPGKSYIRLKSVDKSSKLSIVIMNMIVEKIHRILIEDSDSHMFVSILTFKDIFLYLLRIANQSPINSYNTITISSLLSVIGPKNIQIEYDRPLWQAFEIMTDREKSQWINVVKQNRRFVGMLFREDFRQIFQGWQVNYLWMSVGQFIQWKRTKGDNGSKIPEFEYFEPGQYTRDILWKMVMNRRNTLVCLNEQQQVEATIGLLELFRLYVP